MESIISVSYTHLDVYKRQRIDNLASVSALLESITDGERESGINLIGLFNHEEVGSFTKSGADSTLLESILNRILSEWSKMCIRDRQEQSC